MWTSEWPHTPEYMGRTKGTWRLKKKTQKLEKLGGEGESIALGELGLGSEYDQNIFMKFPKN